jgi:flagellar hook-basal body complex protein FliE
MISAIGSVTHAGASQPLAKTGAAGITGGADFSKVLADVAANTVDTLKAGEATAIGGINGTQTVQQVVDAVMNAEQALQTAIAVRDKLISAYQEISRMAI